MKRSISDTLKILCAISLTIITYAEGFCVEPCRFQVGVDMGYNISLHQSQDGEKCDSELQSRTGWVRHLTGLYNIDSRFTTGLGISIDTYRYAPNSVPIFATFRHRAVQKPIWSDFYYFTNLGYGLPFGQERSSLRMDVGCRNRLAKKFQKTLRHKSANRL